MDKKILGLDLGVTSIGWALITENTDQKQIIDLGSRIIPLSVDDKDEFSKGNAISKNQSRTLKRTQRKGYDRYQLRREKLCRLLQETGMMPGGELMNIPSIELYGLRNKAVNDKVELKELGRILYHLNQKRGYKSSRSDENSDKKDTDYVAEVKNRHQLLHETSLTVGQHFYEELKKNKYYRIKQLVYPREAYIEEFNVIYTQQQKHHGVLTDELCVTLRDETIYYQRKLKSQKGLVGICELAGFETQGKNGKSIIAGPKVAPKSSPLFQVCKIWESINTIRLKNKRGETLTISPEKKQELFDYLDRNKLLSQPELLKLLGLSKDDGWYGNKQIGKGIQGNLTKTELSKHLEEFGHLLAFTLPIEDEINKQTGEIIDRKIISTAFEQEPLYRLWHTIYSISDPEECSNVLQTKFLLPRDLADTLTRIDFTRYGFGNKSAKAMRKILPYLVEGYVYSEACSFAGYNHSGSVTLEQKLHKPLAAELESLDKNSLRQPVVEKILNQLIHLVNAIIKKHGRPDEIRIELARELKQSKEERNDAFADITKRERENKIIADRMVNGYGIRATRNNIIKWRLFHEMNNDEHKMNATCIYCGQLFGITDALLGKSIDIEHIIPRSRLFDDSQSNKTLVHRRCNEDKDDRTAYDFMKSKGETVFLRYLETVDSLYKRQVIRKSKRDKLLMSVDNIPKDFIERQLRQTQYIARKSREILEKICRDVTSTSGSVTEYLRRTWGWSDVLMNLQLPKYRELGLTEWKELLDDEGNIKRKEEVTGWTKRDDHRHHAIDALTIACTQQGFIQRLNTLNASSTRSDMKREIDNYNKRKNLLENFIYNLKPFTTRQVEIAASSILVSFKPGKRAATTGNRKIKVNGKKQVVQTGIIIPRGALSEESVYGKIKAIEKQKPLKYIFEHPDLIFKPYIRELVESRLAQFEGPSKTKLALASLKNDPIYLDAEKAKVLEFATCFKDEVVIKYPIQNLKVKDVQYIVDEKVKSIIKNRLEQFDNKEKEAFKDPVWFNEDKKIPIKTVRCFTRLDAVEAVKKNDQGKEIGFVKPGNNHHIAFYLDENGKKQEHLCSFWHAVERKKHLLPAIITDPRSAWDHLLSYEENYSETFLSKLPKDSWTFFQSLQQNEYFILGLSPEETTKALLENNRQLLSEYLYITWSVSESDYWFRHHLETKNSELKSIDGAKESKRYHRFKSIGAFDKLNPTKVQINYLGDIIGH